MSTYFSSVAPETSEVIATDRPSHASRTRTLVALGLLIALVLQVGVALLTPRDGWADYRANLKAQRHGFMPASAPGHAVKPGTKIKVNGEVDPHC